MIWYPESGFPKKTKGGTVPYQALQFLNGTLNRNHNLIIYVLFSGKALSTVVPEKASSFNIHPERTCADCCFYCGLKVNLSLYRTVGRVKRRKLSTSLCHVQCCGSGIRCLFDPGMGKKSRLGSGIPIWDEHPGSYFRELRNNFLCLKIL
jgi:hypothetical protein